MLPRKAMNWRRVAKSAQALAAHGLLLCFSVLLVLKLDHVGYYSWWVIFSPLWLFHAVVSRGRFSLPAPSLPHDRHWAPCHAIVAMPLLVAFELLLCIYLDSIYGRGFAAVNLKIVFLPLLAFELIILIDNFRMCRALMPGDEESMSDEAIWETLPHFWVAISMVFFFAATTFTLLKLSVEMQDINCRQRNEPVIAESSEQPPSPPGSSCSRERRKEEKGKKKKEEKENKQQAGRNLEQRSEEYKWKKEKKMKILTGVRLQLHRGPQQSTKARGFV